MYKLLHFNFNQNAKIFFIFQCNFRNKTKLYLTHWVLYLLMGSYLLSVLQTVISSSVMMYKTV